MLDCKKKKTEEDANDSDNQEEDFGTWFRRTVKENDDAAFEELNGYPRPEPQPYDEPIEYDQGGADDEIY